MARVKIDQNGLRIAAPGFDVDTAIQKNMLFDNNYPSCRVFSQGIVNINASTVNIPGVPSGYNNRYRVTQVPFGVTMSVVPLCLVGVLFNETYNSYGVKTFSPPTMAIVGATNLGGAIYWRYEPLIFGICDVNNLFIYTLHTSSIAQLYYIVLENPI